MQVFKIRHIIALYVHTLSYIQIEGSAFVQNFRFMTLSDEEGVSLDEKNSTNLCSNYIVPNVW